jgi:hypothetical protein
MAVAAGLIAAVAEVDLQGVKCAAAQAAEARVQRYRHRWSWCLRVVQPAAPCLP